MGVSCPMLCWLTKVYLNTQNKLRRNGRNLYETLRNLHMFRGVKVKISLKRIISAFIRVPIF